MKHAIKIIFIVFFLISCEFKSAQDYYNLAVTYSEQGNNEKAIEMLNKAISKDPKYIKAYINRGAYKSDLGRYKDAIKDYEKVFKLDPQNTFALLNMGRNYTRLGEYNKSLLYLNKALETEDEELFHLELKSNYFGDFENSEEYYVPTYEIYYERGIAFYNIDSLARAYNDFRKAINSNFMISDCYFRIGFIYVSAGKNNLAKEFFRKSKQLGNINAENELKERYNE